jgi:hypothetical protein
MHGSFPLNGTYFQVNEAGTSQCYSTLHPETTCFFYCIILYLGVLQVFADHESSLHPLQVPRSLLWSLRRRFVYFGTSVPNIFKGTKNYINSDNIFQSNNCQQSSESMDFIKKFLATSCL